MGIVRPLIKDLRESYGKKNEYANEKGFDDIERIEDELEGWLGYPRKLVKILKNARNYTTSFT